MANKAQPHLHTLIRSLSMSEKRFFKIYSSRHGANKNSNYVILFDLIDNMETYDDRKVREASFVKNASAEKNYLYRSILKSLNAFHQQSSSKLKVLDWLASAEILKSKGLYDQSMRLAQKAGSLADQNELFRESLLIRELQTELLLKNLNYDQAYQNLESDASLLATIEHLRKTMILTTAAYRENLDRGVVRDHNELSALDNALADPLLLESDAKSSQRAQLHLFSLKLTRAMVAGKTEELRTNTLAIIAHYEAHPFLIEYTPVGYVSSLFILGSAQRDSERYEDALKTVDNLSRAVQNSLVQRSQQAVASAWFYGQILHLQICFKQGKRERAFELAKIAEREATPHLPFMGIPQQHDLRFQLAKAHFYAGKFKTALRHINVILNDGQFKARADFQVTLRLFNLILHHRLGNDFTLEYLSRSTWQYLRKRNRLFDVEKLIIRYLEKYARDDASASAKTAREKLDQELRRCEQDTKESQAFRYLNFRDALAR